MDVLLLLELVRLRRGLSGHSVIPYEDTLSPMIPLFPEELVDALRRAL